MIDLLKPIDLTTDEIKMLVEKHKTWLNQVVVCMQPETVCMKKNKRENVNK